MRRSRSKKAPKGKQTRKPVIYTSDDSEDEVVRPSRREIRKASSVEEKELGVSEIPDDVYAGVMGFLPKRDRAAFRLVSKRTNKIKPIGILIDMDEDYFGLSLTEILGNHSAISIEKLITSENFDHGDWEELFTLTNLKELTVSYTEGYDEEHDFLDGKKFPDTIIKLTIRNHEFAVVPGNLPRNLQELNFTHNSMAYLEAGSLPLSLRTLYHGRETYPEGVEVGILNEGLVSFEVDNDEAPHIEFGALPSTLKVFRVPGFDGKILKGFFPEGIEVIHISHDHKSDDGIFPDSVKELHYSSLCKYEPFSKKFLPKFLESFTVNRCFNQEILKGTLPKTLEVLDLGYDYVAELSPNVLPKNLEILKFTQAYSAKIDSALFKTKIFPRMREIHFGRRKLLLT